MSVTDRIVNYLKNGEFASANLTDFYQLTTGAALIDMEGWRTTGNMVLRGKGTETYGIMAGWRYILPALAEMRYDDAFIDWARTLTNSLGQPRLDKDYLEKLRGKPLNLTIDAIPDGSVIFPGPLGRIKGPPLVGKWIDSPINDITRRGISVATKIARLLWASGGKLSLADNSMRRSGDILGLMVGDICNSMGMPTSNMAVAQANGTNPAGTMDHWYLGLKVMQYFSEHRDADPFDHKARIQALVFAYLSFIHANPADGALLLDLAPLEEGLEAAIIALKQTTPHNYAVRNDSGNLGTSAVYINAQLNNANLGNIKVLLSGGLRAVNIFNLVEEARPFFGAGIGEYFQPHAETKSKGPYEAPVNTEIVTKFGSGISPTGELFNSIKISDEPAKASRGGRLDLWALTDAQADGREAHIEVDLNRTDPANFISVEEGHLVRPLTSIRTVDGKQRTFAPGTRVRRPMVRLLENGIYVGQPLLTDEKLRENFKRDFDALDAELKPVNGQHSAIPCGVEKEHFLTNRNMAENGALIERL